MIIRLLENRLNMIFCVVTLGIRLHKKTGEIARCEKLHAEQNQQNAKQQQRTIADRLRSGEQDTQPGRVLLRFLQKSKPLFNALGNEDQQRGKHHRAEEEELVPNRK